MNTSFINLSYERDLGLDADIYRFDWSYRGFYPRFDNALTYSRYDSYFVTHEDSVIRFPVNQASYDLDIS